MGTALTPARYRSRGRLVGLIGLALVAGSLAGAQAASAADRAYWADNNAARIRVGNLDGGTAADLFDADQNSPVGIALDPARGKVYWSNYASGKIRVGNLDGSGTPTDLFTTTESDPDGVATDPARGKIYWASWSTGKIRVGNLDGSGTPTDLFPTGENHPDGVAIDPAARKIYWTTNPSLKNSTGKIRVGNLDGSGTPADLFPTAESGASGIAVDPLHGKVYWADYQGSEIRVGNLNGTGAPTDLYSSEPGPLGLAIDPSAGRIYWTGYGTGKIRVANLNGTGTPADLFSDENGPELLSLLRAPLPVARPVVAGAAHAGSSLSCSRGAWAGNLVGGFLYRAPRSYRYRWLRDGVSVAGATQSSYRASVGGYYRCGVFAANAAGASPSRLSAPHRVKPPKPVITKTTIDRAKGRARFSFASPGARGFRCALVTKGDALSPADFVACKSPKTYIYLKPGEYTFAVRVTSSAGAGPPAKRSFGG